MDEINVFLEKLKILSDFEKIMIEYIDEGMNDAFLTLFEYFEKFHIKNDYFMYYSILQLLSSFSLSRPANKNIINQIEDIIYCLNDKYDLITIFGKKMLYIIFRKNKVILLWLLQNHLIKLDDIIKKSYRNDFLIYFYPEIYNYYFPNQIKCNKVQQKLINILKHYNLESTIELTFDLQKYIDKRENNQLEHNIINIIKDDNIELFIDLMERSNFKLNKLLFSVYYNQKYSVINLIFLYGSINIFKYLWMRKVDVNENSLKYIIASGNLEIIHLIEKNSKFIMSLNDCILSSILYHRSDLFIYLNCMIPEKDHEKQKEGYITYLHDILSENNNIINSSKDQIEISKIMSHNRNTNFIEEEFNYSIKSNNFNEMVNLITYNSEIFNLIFNSFYVFKMFGFSEWIFIFDILKCRKFNIINIIDNVFISIYHYFTFL